MQHKNAILDVAKDFPNVRVFDLSSIFCKGDYCNISKVGTSLYSDESHLNPFGSMFIAPYIANEIEKQLSNNYIKNQTIE